MISVDPEVMEQLKSKAPQAADLLRQLANPNRLLILCHIAQEERSVGQLEQDLGIRQPGLSQHVLHMFRKGPRLLRSRMGDGGREEEAGWRVAVAGCTLVVNHVERMRTNIAWSLGEHSYA